MFGNSAESLTAHAVARLVSLRHGPHVRILDLTYRIQHPIGTIEVVTLNNFPQGLPCETLGQQCLLPERDTPDEPAGLDEHATGLRGLVLTLMGTAEKPLKGSAIARRLGKRETSYFRGVLGRLRAEGKLDHYDGGYWLSAREPPPPDNRT